jgi:hypothetical protein
MATSNSCRRGAICDGCPRELGRDGSHDLGRRELEHISLVDPAKRPTKFFYFGLKAAQTPKNGLAHNLLVNPKSQIRTEAKKRRDTREYSFGIGSICFLHRKNIWKCKKFQTKKLRSHLDTICAHTMFCQKPTFFVACVKT